MGCGARINAIVKNDTQINFSIISILGQLIVSKTLDVKKGENTITEKSTSGIPGAKIVRITGKDGEVLLNRVIVW